MEEIRISEKISYIETSNNPLSADIGIIKDVSGIWLFDVGNGERSISGLDGEYRIVLSHFHLDHTGNLGRLNCKEVYVSPETYKHTKRGTVVAEDVRIGGLQISPRPSIHCKGSLGLEVDDTYAFVGDGLYCKVKDGNYVYNAQLLKEEIQVLKGLKAEILLVSHYKGLVRKKEEVIGELESIYAMKEKNDPYIKVKIG